MIKQRINRGKLEDTGKYPWVKITLENPNSHTICISFHKAELEKPMSYPLRRKQWKITGITYRALPFGPVPERWGTLYSSLPGIDMEEFVYPSGQSGIKLETMEYTTNILNESELSTIQKVCALFSNMSEGEISQTSHLENGWIENKDNRSAISYQDAFALNYD